MYRFALLALLTTLAGCDDGGIVSKRSNDIFLDPDLVVFSRVLPPRTEVQVVTIRQGGETDLKVNRVYIEDFPECDRETLGFSESDRLPEDVKAMCPLIIDSRAMLPATLGLNEFFDVNIRFQPIEPMVPPDTRIVVESNALDKALQYIDLRFQSATPQIAAEGVVSFPGGGGGTEFLLVRNIGTGPLIVQQRTLSLVSDPAIDPVTSEPVEEFIVSEDRALPWTIPENGAETVTIEYRPFDGSRDTAELVFTSNDPQQPQLTVTLTSAPVFGVLNVDPNPVVFGSPPAGDGVEKVLSFTNSGVRFVDVQSITIEQAGEAYTISGGQQTSFRLAGGQSRDLRVVYQPRDATGEDATLNVNYDDGDDRTAPILGVPLVRSGDTLPGILAIDPPAVDLSDVAYEETRAVELTLTNSGGQPLEITRIALSDESDEGAGIPPSDPEFTITSGGEALTLANGASHTVTVEFTRGAEDNIVHLAALVVESGADSSPDVVFFSSNPPRE